MTNTTDADWLAISNVSDAILKGSISPKAIEGFLKGYSVFDALGKAFLCDEIKEYQILALLASRNVLVVFPSIQLSRDQERVRVLLGDAFVSPERYATAFRLPSIDEAAMASLAVIPWTNEELLEEINIGAVLYPHIDGVTLPLIRKKFGVNQRHQPCFYKNNNWWKNDLHEGLRDHVFPTGWRLVRTQFEPNSTSITWDAQLALVPDSHDRTYVLEIAEMTMLSYQLWRNRPLQNKYAWCKDLDGDGLRCLVGGFDLTGLRLGNRPPLGAWYDGVLVLSRKPSQPSAIGPQVSQA